ncbi:MAG: adenylate/guanylate cyclase domain-containing protein [Betaproteobacteria bacterium]|nr:adenylate/guanylate cyclase domain-containing protein [Betaproteobacteria bacterium]
MADSPDDTWVCSVLFIDIVGYSTTTVAEQLELKRNCNRLLTEALGNIAERSRIILDTGDGAAVTFFGAPENALFAALRARDGSGELSLRLGVNLGPVRVVHDLNGQENVVGDGINVAQRVMSFCEPDQLLVSRSFHEVACRLAPDYVNLFTLQGVRTDKHERAHEVYAPVEDARARLSVAEAEWLRRANPPQRPVTAESERRRSSGTTRRPATNAANDSAMVFDAGANLIVSGYSRESVEKALASLGEVRLISPVGQVGDKWVATCEHPDVAVSACEVEELGYTRIVSGPTREAVAAKVEELKPSGALLVGEIESVSGKWVAICEIDYARR